MAELQIPAGTSILIGAPAHPMDEELSFAIAKLIASIDMILEAHLPQMYALDVMEKPAQVLVIVLDEKTDFGQINDQLGNGLSNILPKDMHLDVWPVSKGHQLINDIRSSDCKI
jgi:hypothetical protein